MIDDFDLIDWHEAPHANRALIVGARLSGAVALVFIAGAMRWAGLI